MRKSRGRVELLSGQWYLRIWRHQVEESTGEILKSRQRIHLGSDQELRSEAAARRAADGWLSRNAPEQLQQGVTIGFATYAEQFLVEHAALYRSSSRRAYTRLLRRHLVVEFGDTPLWRIGHSEIRGALARRRARNLQRATLMAIRGRLLQVLSQARIDGYDAQMIDPKLVRLPREERAEVEQRFISTQELDRILANSVMPWRALWAVMGLAGLRISEALGLTWQHLDLEGEAPLLRVRQGASGGVLLPLKTKTSRADLPLGAELVVILKAYRPLWRSNRAGLLFATRTGRPMAYREVRRYQWDPLLERLAIPQSGFHALRHGLPRRLFAAGCSASTVRALLRHGSLQMTQRYTHATADDLRAAISAASHFHKT